jgi:excinuclease ABC subunit B
VDGRVVMYADNITGSMQLAIDETNRRREIQHKYNVEHGITPKTIEHNVKNTLEITKKEEKTFTKSQLPGQIEMVRIQMKQAANALDFEKAIQLREELNKLEKQLQKLSFDKEQYRKDKKEKEKN